MFKNNSNMKDQKSFEVIVQDCAAEKKDVVDKLVQRSEARLAEMEKKKKVFNRQSSLYEQSDYLNTAFNVSKQQIEAKLANVANIDKSMLVDYFDEIVKDCQKLQKFLSDSTMFLPTYDIKVSQDSLNVLQENIQTAQNTYIPKKKFAFRSKKKMQNGIKDCGDDHEKENRDESDAVAAGKVMELYDCGFRDISDQRLEKTREEIDKKDVGLHQLKNCEVYLYGAPSTVFINGLAGCRVFIGPVTTSVFIENCVSCIFVMACQQLRVHSTTSSSFYLHVTSRIIIEDSNSLQFAPYNWTYEGLERDFETAGLDRDKNNWDSVDDFNWLVSGIPSPNWSLLPESKYMLWG